MTRTSRSAPSSSQIPGSALVTMAATRRNFLRSAGLGGLALSAPGLLAACGSDSGGGGEAASKTVKFGVNEAKGSGPAAQRLIAMAEAYAEKTGVTVTGNYVDHNTFQDSITTYLQGTPDDVFTWFAGNRMNQFATEGAISDVSDIWPLEGINDSFKVASTASDGKQYLVPYGYYPWAVFYKKSTFEKGGYAPPTTLEELTALATKMKADGITPFAFAAKDAWAPLGTFDILNMRINGFQFHMDLMAGDKEWNSSEVKNVFDAWAGLLPFHQEDALGRTWQEAATSMGKDESGMYLLGTFVADGIPDVVDDLDFFTFPELDSSIGATALDAPIDGFCLAAGGQNQDAGKEMMKWLASAEAADAANSNADAPMVAANSGASQDSYSALQKKSAEVVGAAENIAQFLDRDTRSDFVPAVIAGIQEFLKAPGDIDKVLGSIQEQKESIFV